MIRLLLIALVTTVAAYGQAAEAALNRYLEHSLGARELYAPSLGSLYTSQSYLSDLARDPRAARVGDLITVQVAENASALTSGSTTRSRNSDNNASIGSLLGAMNPLRPLPNLFKQSRESSLQGQGATSRLTNVTAVITAHVTHVTANGNLVIEGSKEVAVNSERQLVWIRGVVRQADLQQDNSVSSDRLAMLDLRVNGRGVVASAIKRPNALFRFFRALLPF